MLPAVSRLLDFLSEYIAHRKGLLPLVGILLVLLNFVLVLFFPGWLAQTSCFLHLGVILAIAGFMLARAL